MSFPTSRTEDNGSDFGSLCDVEKLNWPSNTPANSQMPLAYLVRLGQMSSKDEATTMRKMSKLHDSNSQLPSLRHCRFGPIMSSLWSSLPSICRAFLFLATWKDVVSWDHEPWCACDRHDRLQAGHQENKLISKIPTFEKQAIRDLLYVVKARTKSSPFPDLCALQAWVRMTWRDHPSPRRYARRTWLWRTFT